MRILIGLFAILTASMCFAMFAPAGAAPAEPSGASLGTSVVCPDYVDIGIPDPPSGWTPYVMPARARINFEHVSADNDSHTVVCFYNDRKDALPIYTLSKKFPANYKCSVANNGQAPPRTATCAPRIKTGNE